MYLEQEGAFLRAKYKKVRGEEGGMGWGETKNKLKNIGKICKSNNQTEIYYKLA